MTDYNFNRYGWFYFVPIVHDEKAHVTVMRWTHWFWPVLFCIRLHQFLNRLNGTNIGFPIRLYEEDDNDRL